MTNILKHELKFNRKSLIIYSFVVFILIFISMQEFSAGSGGQSMNEIMQMMPKPLQNAMGVGVFDYGVAIEYFGGTFIYFALVVLIHAAMLGANIIAKEERDKTVEFLNTKPVSRNEILTGKLSAAFILIVILNIVMLLSIIISMTSINSEDNYIKSTISLCAGLFCMQIFLAAAGVFFACILKNSKRAASVAMGLAMLFFVLQFIIDSTGQVDFLRWITLYKYFDPKDILKESYNIFYPVIPLVITGLFVVYSYRFYRNRNFKC